MYHGIRDNAEYGHPYYEMHTSPAAFSAHMDHLARKGYRTVDLDHVVELISHGDDVARVVAITFDDGYLDFYSSAFPVLLSHGFTATVFIIPGFLHNGRGGQQRDGYMNWAQLREIRRYGIHIGSHSMTHARLHELPPDDIDRELGLSRHAIEEGLHCSVSSFSYPYSFPEHNRHFIQDIRARLQKHGYRHAVSTILGTAGYRDNRFLLPRLPVNEHDDLALFDAKLQGAYDWMHAVQRIRKYFTQSSSCDTRSTTSHSVPA